MPGDCFSYSFSTHCSRKLDFDKNNKDCVEPGLPALAGCFICLICFSHLCSTCCSR